MDESLHYHDDILMQYIDGVLPPEDAVALELQMKADAALRERVEKLRLSVNAVRYFGTAQKVRSIHQEMMEEMRATAGQPKVVSMRKKIIYALAVAASIIVIVVSWNWYNRSSVNAAGLYDQAFVDYDASAIRGAEQTSVVEEHYRNKDFQRVISEAEKAGTLTAKDSLLVGISYLKTGKPGVVTEWLGEISRQGVVKQDAEFYLALAYLKLKRYAAAVDLMKSIRADVTHPYRGQFSEEYIDKVEGLNE
jgi:hypothetical protein